MCVTALYQCMQQGTSNICIVPYSTPQQTCTQACAESMCNGHYQDKTWLAYGGDPPMIGYARKYCAMCIAVEPTGRCQPWNICTDLSMTCTALHLPSATLPWKRFQQLYSIALAAFAAFSLKQWCNYQLCTAIPAQRLFIGKQIKDWVTRQFNAMFNSCELNRWNLANRHAATKYVETYLQIDVAMTNKRACIVLYLQATIHLNPYQPTIKTFNIANHSLHSTQVVAVLAWNCKKN